MKQFYKSKRFWTGLIGLLTGISLMATGEKSLSEILPELVLTAIGFIQTIIALASGQAVGFGKKNILGKSV
jgi:hypothetical protein